MEIKDARRPLLLFRALQNDGQHEPCSVISIICETRIVPPFSKNGSDLAISTAAAMLIRLHHGKAFHRIRIRIIFNATGCDKF